jgi:hypothetical protein
MKPDSMLVEPEYIGEALQAVAGQGPAAALGHLHAEEPALASFLEEKLAALAGRLTLSGAPRKVVHGVHGEILFLVLSSLQALRRGHYELWKDTTLGDRLAPPGAPPGGSEDGTSGADDGDIPF